MKLMILYASAGGGHQRAAEALAEAAAQLEVVAVIRDILDFVPRLYRKTYADGFLRLVRAAPELWGYMYNQSDRTAQRPVERRVRSVFNRLQALSFYRFLERTAPDAAICTHFMPLELIGSMPESRRKALPLFGVVTDFAAHSLWYCSGVNAYYVASDEARHALMRKGQPAEGIRLTGIPVMSAFARREPAAVVRRRMGLSADLPLALLLGGGCGVGPAVEIIQACATDPPPCQLVVVTGKNGALENRARAAAEHAPLPIEVLGFVHNVHELMDAADLIIGKSGGLTSAEALAKGKPMMIVDPIPGQEQRNAEFMIESGCAVRLFESADAPWKIRDLLAGPRALARMSENALRLGRPHAAAEILREVAGFAKSSGR